MNKKLSILIPVYNEEKTLLNILERINESKIENFDFEIIIINDGSDDDTLNVIKENSDLYDKVINLDKNRGKGYAVKSGLKIATGDYVIFQDADLEYDPKDFIKFTNLINKLLITRNQKPKTQQVIAMILMMIQNKITIEKMKIM